MLLACQNITKAFGITTILSDVSFTINEHEKIAVVGINGAGKSTLFKIIIKELAADSGQVVLAAGRTIGYLSQQQDLDGDKNIYDEVLSVKSFLLNMEADLRNIELEMKHASGEALDKLMNTYARLNHDFEINGGYSLKSEVTGILKGLGFTEAEFTKSVATLSGGQKTRVALGKLLLTKPDLILLDEPTNHLDMESITWLETYLSNYTGAVLLIAHDRYFLDKIVSAIVEIDNTKAIYYTGNYTAYAEKRLKLREDMLKQYMNQQREIKHQEEVITKLKSFNREKSIKRAESREKMLNKIERLERPVEIRADMDIRLTPNLVSGNDVLTVTGLTKSFKDNRLFDNINFEVKRGDKIALIGNNGTGKTTMLKIITGLLEADRGEIRLGAKVYIGYYDQAFQVLDPDKSIFDEIQSAYPKLDNTKVRNTLAAFLFTGDDVFKLIRDISGGERGRVSLAKLMLSDANFLILDEPTNHLDMVSKEILEHAISSYEGTVLYVSHDRYFINKTATRILELADNKLYNFNGAYDYYLEKRDLVLNAARAADVYQSGRQAVSQETNESRQEWEQKKKEQAALRKKQNELARTEQRINELEALKAELEEQLNDEAICTNSGKLIEIHNKIEAIDEETLLLLEQWESLQ